MSRPSTPPSGPPHKRARRSSSPNSDRRPSLNGKPQHALDLPPLSLSILGVEPLDEFIKAVADFIHHMIMHRPPDLAGDIEVEAKVGILLDKHSGQRISLPILTETILSPNYHDIRFESNMSARQHRHYNNLLNNLKTNSPNASKIGYKHLYLHDSFFPSDVPGEKIRVTRDEKSQTVVACTKKIRLGDLNIYSPKQPADWRISVNLEVPVQHPLGSATHLRKKDRLSYSHEEFAVDLTQVTSSQSSNAPSTILHELELEISRPEFLLSVASSRGQSPDPQSSPESIHSGNAFDELIRAFVNNARILVRNADGGDGA